jgi:hypothetical protein
MVGQDAEVVADGEHALGLRFDGSRCEESFRERRQHGLEKREGEGDAGSAKQLAARDASIGS